MTKCLWLQRNRPDRLHTRFSLINPIKVETHNHPTAIAPYPGAGTGAGGEIRDEGAVGRGVKSQTAEELFDQMVLFAEYCFNKSHSTAYGAVTYHTAYLKAHYPVAYMVALLTVNAGIADKVQRYIANCNAIGIDGGFGVFGSFASTYIIRTLSPQ